MNIVELLHQRKDAKPAQKDQAPAAPLSPRSEFAELKKSLGGDVLNDIKAFRTTFPQLREHVIFKIMKKHDFKRNLVETELKFIAEMQGSRPVEQREPRPKKPFVPKEDRPRKDQPPAKVSEETPKEAEVKPIAKQNSGREEQGQRFDQGPRNDNYKGQRGYNQRFRDDRGEWDNRPHRDRPQSDHPDRPYQNQGQQRPQGQNYQNGPVNNRGPQQPHQNQNQNYYQPRQNRDKFANKKQKGPWQSQSNAVEYVAKQPEEEKPKPTKPQQESNADAEKALSNINEESEDQSHHRLQAGDSTEKRKSSRHSPKRHQQGEHKGKHHHDAAPNAAAGHHGEDTLHAPEPAEVIGHPLASPALDAIHQTSGHKQLRPPTAQEKVFFENGLIANGFINLLKIFAKKEAQWLRQFIQAVHALEFRHAKNEARNGQDKRGGFFDGKKRKPAIKNNFETEENDESTNERAKKMNYFVGSKRFESEEERLKGERERVMESRLNDNMSQFNWLSQKVKALEDEVAALRAVNQELMEGQRSSAGHHEENVYCFVPFHFVKDFYPFNSIKMNEVKSGKVYMVKRDEQGN